jgi:polar amino acid transport system substrate-binding protein
MKTTPALLTLALFACLPGQAGAEEKPDKVTLCHEDGEAYPWLILAKPGYSQIMMQMVEKELGVPVKLVAKPWKQCMADVKAGSVDGAINASFSKERAEFSAYPTNFDGEPDASKRMYRATYALYRLKGSSVSWDGKKLNTGGGPVGAQTSFSIIALLKELGAKVDDSSAVSEDLLKKVVAGTYPSAALQTTDADGAMQSNPDWKARLERVNPPLTEKPYYTIFSKAFFAKYQPTAKSVWRIEGKVRESADFKKQVGHLVKTVD